MSIPTVELQHVRFDEEFDRYGAGADGSPYWDPSGGTWTVTGGYYQYTGSTEGDHSHVVDLSIENGRIKYDQYITGAWQVGVMFRAEVGDEDENCYWVRPHSANLFLYKRTSGSNVLLDSTSISITTGTYYDFEIHFKEDNQGNLVIKVYLEGTEEISYTDTTPHSAGSVGIIKGTGTGTPTARFQYFEVFSIEAHGEEMFVKDSIGDRIKRFGMKLFNPEGERSSQFSFNQEVEVWRGSTPTRIFRGYIETITRESPQGQYIILGGRDVTAQLLMVQVTDDFTSQDLAQTLKDLLTSYAPDFDQTNIENSGISLAPHYKLKRLYIIARELAQMADFEVWVDQDKNVYYRPKLYTDSGVTFTPTTNLLDYKFPEEGHAKITRIAVYGKEGVLVQVENRALREELGHDRDGTPIVDPSIQTNAEAKKRGEAYLAQHSGPLIGQLFTYGQESLNVGEIVQVTIDEEGIDTEFLVLQIEYVSPAMPETIITVAEYTTGIEDIIASLRTDADILLASEADLEATLERWVSLGEEIVIEETKLTISQKAAADSFILGHSTYGVLGAGGYGLGDRSGEWVIIHEEEDP